MLVLVLVLVLVETVLSVSSVRSLSSESSLCGSATSISVGIFKDIHNYSHSLGLGPEKGPVGEAGNCCDNHHDPKSGSPESLIVILKRKNNPPGNYKATQFLLDHFLATVFYLILL